VVVIAVLATVMTTSALTRGTSTASAAVAPTKVEVVGSNGSTLKVAGGVLSSETTEPGTRVQFQAFIRGGSPAVNVALLSGIAASAKVTLSDVAISCPSCTVAGVPAVTVDIYNAQAPNCASASPFSNTVITGETLSPGELNDEFTFPTGRIAPIWIHPTSPWCLGISVFGSEYAFVAVDGYVS
jgi:hypothetical protein